jgi:hypothetical protein|tara:strand:- start:347 stop:523 length:177 start_codon:yes stop_codon:yes gene_type:complete
MTELKQEHFEVIDKNKHRIHEEKKQMREELAFYVLNCSDFNMVKMYDEYKRLKRNKTE